MKLKKLLKHFCVNNKGELKDLFDFGDEYMWYNYDADTWHKKPQTPVDKKVYCALTKYGIVSG
jgi:hypothetical protein